ncbi:type II toxin-antitoxin system RelE/ParE family toxin [Ferribacterium limneticum]|uniref:type II toxin-antitoxin system RelE/ParE family toxin n=1 Tax=Ferribacterium limneticum TaxID=76259 RepID=UPI001CFBD815|nr:type II toxin-antitoxin system RelE/ParE family toxin [Ferribacterium limneticum]UCV29970.1 type II toxin-antitoxin system RelE/ParE family toxin [Ferribacterium limneticum]UCV33889.1 type II toxin-antitoxin system RelE/ParE family toxin [Ferribacterium limneticum]
MASVFYSVSAENDLLEAWLYVAADSVSTADRMLDQIEAEAIRLLDQPLIGHERNELAPGMRSWPTSKPYILFYFPNEKGIVVASVLHHARDIPAIDLWPAH